MELRRGQSTLELCFLLVVAILALTAMWPLLRDAISSRFKSTADTFSFGLQFEPNVTVEQCSDKFGASVPC